MSVYDSLKKRRDEIDAELRRIDEAAKAETRSLTDEESDRFDALVKERGKNVKREEKLREQELAEVRADKARAEITGVEGENRATATTKVGPDPDVYREDDPLGHSFFRDLFHARTNHEAGAIDRLTRQTAIATETRAGDLASSSSTTGGTFAPPLWLVDQYVKLARPGRVTADLMVQNVLPSGVSSINLPTVATGTTTAIQSTQNTALSDTAATTGSVSTGITTVGGKQIVSLQMIDQSGIPFDKVVLQDLTADYAKQIGALVVSDLTGITGQNTITNSNASVTLAGLWGDLANAISQVATGRFLPPDAVIMHPQRWYWILSQLDAQSRPLVVASGQAFNQLATTGTPMAEGSVGNLLGLPVYIDPNMPISGTSPNPVNAIYVLRRADNWLFESSLRTQSFDATYADQASVLFRVHGYAGFINRYPKAVSQIGGPAFSTAPAFAG